MKNLPDCSDGDINTLLDVARGTQLILGALWENWQGPREAGQNEIHSIAAGLSTALRQACDPVDAYYFHDAGAVSCIPTDEIVTLLENKLTNLRKTLDRENAAKSAMDVVEKAQSAQKAVKPERKPA